MAKPIYGQQCFTTSGFVNADKTFVTFNKTIVNGEKKCNRIKLDLIKQSGKDNQHKIFQDCIERAKSLNKEEKFFSGLILRNEDGTKFICLVVPGITTFEYTNNIHERKDNVDRGTVQAVYVLH